MPLPDISLKRINCTCHVHTPMFEYNNKKYIRLTIPDGTTCSVRSAQSRVFPKNPNVDNPLDGNVLTVKVPFRYRRVTCSYEGAPVQSLKKSDKVEITTDFTGAWNVGNHSGYTWKLSNIKLLDSIIV